MSIRTPGVGSMTRDGLTLGWGMAGAAWIAARFPAEASVQLHDDGSARVFKAEAGQEVARLDHDGPVAAVAFSPDGSRVGTGSGDG